MPLSSIDSLKIKAKLLQKAKKKAGERIALKEAFTTIAKASGHATWKDLKESLEIADVLNPPQWSAQWKIWFNSKEEALPHLSADKYLLPYRNQFFICDEHYIRSLGIDPDDEDLRKVGRDFSSPQDKEAWKKLFEKMRKGQLK